MIQKKTLMLNTSIKAYRFFFSFLNKKESIPSTWKNYTTRGKENVGGGREEATMTMMKKYVDSFPHFNHRVHRHTISNSPLLNFFCFFFVVSPYHPPPTSSRSTTIHLSLLTPPEGRKKNILRHYNQHICEMRI